MENIAPALLDWFYKNHRILPFREDPTPYHVWLSEVMLQQTRVSAALPYYERFLAALPDIPALAACDEESCTSCGGSWLLQPGAQPAEGRKDRLRTVRRPAARRLCRPAGLPGIGDYTAGAIASISLWHPGAGGGRQCAAGVFPPV